MKKYEEIWQFISVLENVLHSMTAEFNTFDYDSPIFYWLMHSVRQQWRVSTMIPKTPYLSRYIMSKGKSIPRKIQHTEWVYIEDFSYTNFILHFIDPKLFFIDTIEWVQNHDKRPILVPLELKNFYASRGLLCAKWLKNY